MSESQLIERLKNCNINQVCDIPFKNIIIPARVTKVIDGDTIKVVILLGEHPLSIKVRLTGIDAPETTLKGNTTQLEKDAGLIVKEYVCGLLDLQSIVYVKLVQADKYGGRYVGHVYKTKKCIDCNTCISQRLLNLKYAKLYDGGKKSVWTDAELKHIVSRDK